MAAVEKVRLEGTALKDVFNEDFLSKTAYTGDNIFSDKYRFRQGVRKGWKIAF